MAITANFRCWLEAVDAEFARLGSVQTHAEFDYLEMLNAWELGTLPAEFAANPHGPFALPKKWFTRFYVPWYASTGGKFIWGVLLCLPFLKLAYFTLAKLYVAGFADKAGANLYLQDKLALSADVQERIQLAHKLPAAEAAFNEATSHMVLAIMVPGLALYFLASFLALTSGMKYYVLNADKRRKLQIPLRRIGLLKKEPIRY